MIQKGLQAVFGEMTCPKLPEGFTLKIKPKSYARAVKDGKEYVIFLNPNRLAPVIASKRRNIHVDLKSVIPF